MNRLNSLISLLETALEIETHLLDENQNTMTEHQIAKLKKAIEILLDARG